MFVNFVPGNTRQSKSEFQDYGIAGFGVRSIKIPHSEITGYNCRRFQKEIIVLKKQGFLLSRRVKLLGINAQLNIRLPDKNDESNHEIRSW